VGWNDITSSLNALFEAGHWEQLIAATRQILGKNPENGVVRYYLGLAYLNRGEHESARDELILACKALTGDAGVRISLGNAFVQLGMIDAAVDSYEQALRLEPRNTLALGNLGLAYLQGKQFEAAIGCYRKAAMLEPDNAPAHFNLGFSLQMAGQLLEALSCYQKALSLRPDYLEAEINNGGLLQKLGRIDAAIASYKRARRLEPANIILCRNLGNALAASGKYEEARATFAAGQRLEPHKLEWSVARLGTLLPAVVESTDHQLQLRAGLLEEMERISARTGAVSDLDFAAFVCFYLPYHGMNDRPILERMARLIRQKAEGKLLNAPIDRSSASDSVIRIGFISANLYDGHTILKLTQGFLRMLDRKRFHVTVIHAPSDKIDATWNVTGQLADTTIFLPPRLEEAQRTVVDLKLDVLHYTDIGMSPFTYFLAFGRLAPVQTVSWGHPVTTGIDSVDYFISFDAAEPEGAESHYSEALVRFRRIPSYYEAVASKNIEMDRVDLGLPSRGRLYGCFQSLFKFHPDFDEVLADIVHRDAEGWIITLEGHNSAWREQLRARWKERHPILLTRVVFLDRQPHATFMALLGKMDVLLDTPHFGSGNTLFEALSCFIPCVTWPGGFMRGRLVAGIYEWLGISDAPIANTLKDYAALAVEFATDLGRRGALISQLAEKAAFCFRDDLAVRELESFVEQAVAASRQGQTLRYWTSGLHSG